MALSARTRLALRAYGALAGLAMTAYLVLALYGSAGGTPGEVLYSGLLYGGALGCLARGLLVPRERWIWLALGASLVIWASADLYYLLAAPDFPSISDAGWLVFYPTSYVAIVLLLRHRVRRVDPGLWLDGALGACALASIGAALVFQPIADAGSGGTAAIVTNLAYPVGDLLLLALVTVSLGLTGWRPDRMWLTLGAGLVLSAVADSWYLYDLAVGSYREGGPLEALWPASVLLIAAAAWQPSHAPPTAVEAGWRLLILPVSFMGVALGVLVVDHFEPVNTLALVLATAGVAVGAVRAGLTFRDNVRMLAASRREALTDPLTGLGNRRRLVEDLEHSLAVATAAEPRLLVLFDLNGFKSYNDTYGHPAGDELLVRLGRRLGAAIAPFGAAYRLGGDEFCVLVRPGRAGPDPVVAAAGSALSERGEGFAVDSAFGHVLLPSEAQDSSAVLQLADRRMYRHKGAGRASASRQTRDVLLSALHERQPALGPQPHDAAELASAVGRRLGMQPEALDEVARAAELHDVGKVAIPDAILEKPGPLDDDEWSFMRRHTLIGERILASAPALVPVARLVRSSHERFDGAGYPDGLAGEDIPLGARIVAVCDAYDAMTSDRPYRLALTGEQALAELRRCAGSQFDPAVVEAFAATLAESLQPV